MRFTIHWGRMPSQYTVSRPNYDGGEVVDAADFDALLAIVEHAKRVVQSDSADMQDVWNALYVPPAVAAAFEGERS